MFKKIKPYIIALLIPLAVGGLSAFLTKDNISLYRDVVTPPLSPPSFLFPLVWTILYILMGVSSLMIYKARSVSIKQRASALSTYASSLIINFAWSIIFFNFRAFFLAFVWLVLLFYLIIRTILEYKEIEKRAAYLQIPYAVWVAFAGYLSFSIWLLN